MALSVQSGLGHDLVGLPASQIMAFLERMERVLTSPPGKNPAVQGGQGEPGDSHGLPGAVHREYLFLLRGRKEIEELRAGHVVSIHINPFLLQEGQGVFDKSVAHFASLENDRPRPLALSAV